MEFSRGRDLACKLYEVFSFAVTIIEWLLASRADVTIS